MLEVVPLKPEEKRPEIVEKCETKEELEAKFRVKLSDTILFPEGGGQPTDYGIFFVLPPEAVEDISNLFQENCW